ncbi:MAG: polysaccharide biosynthesis protein, partial [Erysipelotrichaceae bacterium]|nr:polysaccharide biosynthesis protein [Erysipelotrichaceae bacterium]
MKNFFQAQSDNFKKLISARSLELIIIDTGIILAVWLFMQFLSTLSIYTFKVHGAFTYNKIIALYLCIILLRTIFSMYNSVLRYAEPLLYAKLIISDTLACLIYFFIGRYIYKPVYIGFAFTFIMGMTIVLTTIVSRLAYQLLYSYTSAFNDDKDPKLAHKINIAIIGAGNIGASLASELIRNPKSHYKPLMFIDRDKRKIGSSINGIRVYPENDDTLAKIKSMPIQEIVIAIPDSTLEQRNVLYEKYKETNCKIKVYDYPIGDKPGEKSNEGSKRTVRDIHIEDLLFRDTLSVKSDAAAEFYRNKVVLVTGGGGSIGSELCRQIAKLGPKKLVILDIY